MPDLKFTLHSDALRASVSVGLPSVNSVLGKMYTIPCQTEEV